MNAERLLAFAEDQIGGTFSHQDVRTRDLADAFRYAFGLGAFPRLPALLTACKQAGIVIEWMPPGWELEGFNAWPEDGQPYILIRSGMSDARTETTLCHEVREVLENAFKRVNPLYDGLDTHDNPRMNPESDEFAANLLMESAATRFWLEGSGFDYAEFARLSGRSIASVGDPSTDALLGELRSFRAGVGSLVVRGSLVECRGR